jgi:shikimate dehydrogenase
VKFALIGHPVAHSLSPVIHSAAYLALGQTHQYELIDAPHEADVARVVAALKSGELAGINVTIPWKREAFAAAERRSVLAESLGVANVLAREGQQIVAHNTDALALEVEFKRLVDTRRAIVLGSGGAAPAVVAAARAAGITEVFVSARRFESGVPSASWPGATELLRLGAELLVWPANSDAARAEFERCCQSAGLVVQCTSAGMQGKDSGEPLAGLVPWAKLPADALAYDLVYAPLETPFLRVAREAGRPTAHGLNMLVGQAAAAIEIWLGQKPPAEPLLAAALAELERRQGS